MNDRTIQNDPKEHVFIEHVTGFPVTRLIGLDTFVQRHLRGSDKALSCDPCSLVSIDL